MIPLALSILSSSVLLVIFKYFDRFKIHTFQAITVNYIVATGLGFLMTSATLHPTQIIAKPWALSAFILGSSFICVFYLMALSSQKVGVAVSSVANKMSLVIPVTAGFILYNESLTGLKIAGILLAILAVTLVSIRKADGVALEKKYLFLPVLIFLGSGYLDTFLKYVQNTQLSNGEIEIFSASLFLTAALIGSIILLTKRLFQGSIFQPKSIVAGIALGIPNYFSIHFLLQALDLPNLESTVVFPINNTGVVLLSTLLAILLFAERLSKLNWIGISLAIISIALIAIA